MAGEQAARASGWIRAYAWGAGCSATRTVGAWADRLSALAAGLALVGLALNAVSAPAVLQDRLPGHVEHEDQRAAQIARRDAIAEMVRYRGGETLSAVYGGAPHTYPSDVRIERPGSDLTLHGLPWEGRPFEHPIYYGARVARWLPASAFGAMLDFTHSKVYSPMEAKVRFSGARDGVALPGEARIEEVFHKLEFTHGHNMLTLNGLWRLPFSGTFLSPYVGAGFGVSLPHSEVQLKGLGGRTYEYQYTGPAFQLLLGIELRIPKASYFVEYKWTSASYHAPLHERDGRNLFSDLANQLARWKSGKEPVGGWATTRLTSHQVISGGGFRTAPAVPLP